MRRVCLLFILVLSFMVSQSKVITNDNMIKPDFAYPATVSVNARKQLDDGVAAKDAVLTLRALITYSIAQTLIAPDNTQACIRLAEDVADKFMDSDIYSLYLVFIGELYNSAYSSDRWVYDRRDLPLLPLSDNITEWSGKQFRYKVNQLVDAALNPHYIAVLKNQSVRDYADLIVADDLTALYYPTLADFVYSKTLELSEARDNEILTQAVDSSKGYTPSEILWRTLRITNGTSDNEIEIVDNEDEDADYAKDGNKSRLQLFGLFAQYSDSKYAGLILDKLGALCSSSDIGQLRNYVTLAREYLDRVPDCYFKNNILNHITYSLRGSYKIFIPSLCSPGTPVRINVFSENAAKINIKVYSLGETTANGRSLAKIISQKSPIQTIDVDFSGEAPFQRDTTVTVKFDEPGYYAINPNIVGDNPDYPEIQLIRCIPVYPFAITDMLSHTDVVVVDPATGIPIKGADVNVVLKDKVLESVQTDGRGIAQIKYKTAGNIPHLSVGYGGKSYKFEDVGIQGGSYYKADQTAVKAVILTDRSIYHQGDQIKALGVVYRCTSHIAGGYSSQLMADTDVLLTLSDANMQPIDTVRVHTDSFGRAVADFTVPTDRMTGRYTIEAKSDINFVTLGSQSVMVSDFKMPDYQLDIISVACDVPSKGAVTVNAQAMTYSGMPVGDADIEVEVRRYDRGLWWRSADYNTIYDDRDTTDAMGKLSLVLPDTVFAGDDHNLYSVILRAVSSTGEAIEATEYFTLKAQYHITLDVKQSCVNGESPFRPTVSVDDAAGLPVTIPLVWRLVADTVTVASGDYDGEIDLSAIKPGVYTLTISSKDREIADEASAPITVYNISSGIVPNDDAIWCEKNTYMLSDGDSLNILIGTANQNTNLYYSLVTENQEIFIKSRMLDTGYHELSVNIPETEGSYILKLFVVKDCRLYTQSIDIYRKRPTGLKVVGESFRDRLIPMAAETWQIKVMYSDGRPLEAALALDMYNKALDAIYPHTFSLNFSGRYSLGQYRVSNPYLSTLYMAGYANIKYLQEQTLGAPEFEYYGYGFGGNQIFYKYMSRPSMSRAMNYSTEDAVEYEYDAAMPILGSAAATGELKVDAEVVDDAGLIDTQNDDPKADPDVYRDAEVPLVIWAPRLTTDADGNICYTFMVPNANTTWCLRAVAWSQDMEVGSLMREFVASKPVMVKPNLPRFMRSGDSATVMAAIMNNSDSTQTVTATVEVFNPLTSEVLRLEVFDCEIGPKQTATVSIDIQANTDASAIGYRVRATNGDFTDGEQAVIRILPSEASLIETQPFYLNPGQGEYVTRLPEDKDARISLTFCENPAWTIVSALPGLRTEVCEYANSAAAAVFSAAISQGIISDNPVIADAVRTWIDNPADSALVSMLQKNETLKIAMLNCTPWVRAAQSDTERMAALAMMFDRQSIDMSIDKALKILSDLQRPDGGWAWGKWCDESSVWVTSNVLNMLGGLKSLGWLPKDKALDKMLNIAVKYYDGKVKDTDLLYCLTRPYYQNIPISKNGTDVIKNTINDIKKNWKHYNDPAYKAMAAMALYLNGDKAKAHELMRSVSEFGVYTESQGLKFPSVNALYSYAILLEAYGMIEPDSKDVDGLRQQLIVRKQATDWGSAVVTSEVVKSILTSGTKWTVPAKGAEIKAGDAVIRPNSPVESATGSLTADLSKYAGDTLTISTSPDFPSYGAVYSQFSRQMDAVKASACDDLDIEKSLTVRRGSEWVYADTLRVGDRVKVQLTIHCKRNLQYVSIIDERPATFEPVEQLPGWMWSEGVAFYRENRDSQTDLHIVHMAPGTYLLTYEMDVNLAGRFSSGIATIQSQYSPEISAHSSGCIINVDNKE